MSRISRRLLLTLGTLALCPFAFGLANIEITWSAPQAITADTDVSTAGTLVRAFNVGPSAVPAVTLNTVNFESFAFSGGTTASVGNFSFTENVGTLSSASDAGAISAPFLGLSANYQSLLASYGSASTPQTLTLTITGLTPGQTYLFQWWNNFSPTTGVSHDTTATATNTVSLDANTTNTAGSLGQFATGTFTAGGSTPFIEFNGTQFPTINAFQLRDITAIPEPATSAALTALATLALALVRRRHSAP